MKIARRTISIIISFILLAPAALAQDAATAKQESRAETVVTARATESGVRFVAPEEARRIRLEVYSPAGERLYDSDFRQGSILDWDGQGLADGSYLCVVTTEDLSGARSRKVSVVKSEAGRLAVGREGETELQAAFSRALAAAGVAEGETAAAPKKSQAMTVAAHDGRDGQVTSTAGALTFRTGNVFAGKDREHVRITPEGNVGIGTDKPEATLDVAGTIRARGGILFPDGSVLTSAAAGRPFSVAAPSASGETTTAAMSGTGTTGALTKWVDGANGVVGDSVIRENAGNVGIGTSAPDNVLEVRRDQPYSGTLSSMTQLMVRNDNPNGFSAVSIWGNGAERGRYQYNSANPNIFLTSIGQVPFYFGTNDTVRMSVAAGTGNVGIGTGFAPATQKLEVAGNVKLTGASTLGSRSSRTAAS